MSRMNVPTALRAQPSPTHIGTNGSHTKGSASADMGTSPMLCQRSPSSTKAATPRCTSPGRHAGPREALLVGTPPSFTRCGCSATNVGARLTHSAKKLNTARPAYRRRPNARFPSLGRAPSHLENVPENRGIEHQHHQWCQHQPGRAKPGLSVARMHFPPGQLADEPDVTQRKQVGRQRIQNSRLMKWDMNNKARAGCITGTRSGFRRIDPALGNFLQQFGTQQPSAHDHRVQRSC
jgi:hypothetical protein